LDGMESRDAYTSVYEILAENTECRIFAVKYAILPQSSQLPARSILFIYFFT